MCVYNYHDCTIIREEPGPKLQRQTSVACRKFCSRFLLLVSQDSGTSWASGCSSLMSEHLFLIQILRKKKKKKSAEDLIYMPSFAVIQISMVEIRISFFPRRYLIIREQRIAGAENPTPAFTKIPIFSASSAPWSGSVHGEGRNMQPPNFISQVNAVRKCFWRRKVRFLGNRFWNGRVDLNTDPNQGRCPL